jgi:putative membrane protein
MRQPALIFMLIVFAAVLLWSGIHPVKRSIWFYEASPAIVLVLILLFTYRRFPLTPLSYWIILLGSLFMLIGGHYTYGNMPLFNIFEKIFDLKRNHFDRLGHIFQGMLLTVLIREYFIRTHFLRREKWLFLIVGMLSIAISAGYEIFEFGIASLFDGNIQNFLGYQGDIFDSHWDIISALLGTIIVLFLGGLQNRQIMNIKSRQIH